MDRNKAELLHELNRAIIRFRGSYSVWSNAQGISYHEMLVYYTIREYGFCTQKLICESYLLPKQTINNVFANLRKKGILLQDRARSTGREKAFVLSEAGKENYLQCIGKLDEAETDAFDRMGEEKMQALKDLFLEYDKAQGQSLGETK